MAEAPEDKVRGFDPNNDDTEDEANFATVVAGPRLSDNKVALWERDDRHPGGEVTVRAPAAGEDAVPVKVFMTAMVSQGLSRGMLAIVGSRQARGRTVAGQPAEGKANAKEAAKEGPSTSAKKD